MSNSWTLTMHLLTTGSAHSIYKHWEQDRLLMQVSVPNKGTVDAPVWGTPTTTYTVGDQEFEHYHRALRYARSEAA